ncbi:MAG: ATP-binding protein [Clostridiales bacterium]|nr:ATP-binding protein [Clostridiales bacterium]MDD7594922.1 ATP-binding protein [Clostridiales bacterium]
MGYSRENYRLVREEYENRSLEARNAADARRSELHRVIPRTEEIDRELSATGIKLMGAALGVSHASVDDIRAGVVKLRAERAALLAAAGYPENYSEPHYECEKCQDTGYVDGYMCSCMKQRLIMAGYESSGIARLMQNETFDTFSLDYYADDRRNLENMRYIYQTMRRFAETFNPKSSKSIALFGGTGLGKTHLSTAAAKVIIERGFDVVYTGAIGMFSDFEKVRFGNASGRESGENTDRYFDCDLLIIDDLGSEVANQFTVSCLYDVINTRINKGLPMILSTNLRQEELRQRYWDRITSRIFGEFVTLMLTGTDVRAKKLREGTKLR